MQENLLRAFRSYYRLEQFKKDGAIDLIVDQEKKIYSEVLSKLSLKETLFFIENREDYSKDQNLKDKEANQIFEIELDNKMASLH